MKSPSYSYRGNLIYKVSERVQHNDSKKCKKATCSFLKKLKIEILCDPVVFWVFIPKIQKYNLEDICTLMLTVALFTIAKVENNLSIHGKITP